MHYVPKTLTYRLVSHFLLGLWLGTATGLFLVFYSTGQLYRLIESTFGPVAGEMDFIFGCAILTGVGTFMSGLVLERVHVKEDA